MPFSGDREHVYEIRVQGHISPEWSDWFAGMEITHQPDGESVLRGALSDQAALHGVLTKIRDMGVALIQVGQKAEASGTAEA